MTAEQIAHALGKFTTKTSGGFTACCPSHNDDNPSLSIDDTDNGSVLVKCWAGCTQDAVIKALKDRNLWPFKDNPESSHQIKPKVVARYYFRDQSGIVLYWKERLEPGKGGRKKDFRFRYTDPATGKDEFGHGKHNPHVLYNLDKIGNAATINFHEGEGQADVMTEWGLTGTSLDCGAQSSLNPEMKAALDALTGKNVALYPDNDETGRRYMESVARYLHGKAKKIKVVILPGLPEKGDIVNWKVEAVNNRARLLELMSQTPEWMPQAQNEVDEETSDCERMATPAFDMSRLRTGAEISAGDYNVNFIVDKLIPEDSIILLYAKGGSGKSTLATQLAASVDTGKPFLGLDTQKRPVVVVDYENPMAILKRRIDAVEGADDVIFWTGQDKPPQLNKTDWSDLQNLIATLDKPLMIIDTLSSSCSGLDILSNKDYAAVMAKIVALRNQGATIILLHHTPKQDATKYIGASVIYNQCDHIIAMYPVKAAGQETEANDDDEAHTYRLGTKDKTRFEHHHLFVEFDEDNGIFKRASDPQQHILDQLENIIRCQPKIIQADIIRKIGAVAPEKRIRRLLGNNEGLLWTVEKGEKRAKHYTLILKRQNGPPIYSDRTAVLESSSANISAELPLSDAVKSGINTESGNTAAPTAVHAEHPEIEEADLTEILIFTEADLFPEVSP